MSDIAQLGLSVRSDGVVVATNRLQTMERQSGRTEGAAMRMAKGLKSAFAGVALAAATMFGAQAVIGTLAGFEKSMAAVGAITRASEKDLAALRETAKQLGATTEFSASQAADGLKFFGMAGWNAAQSIAAIPAILDLATAAQMDLATAADISSNIMTAFGIAAEDASAAADVLAAVSSRANTDVTQLGDGMKYVGPVASALGISMGEAAAAMGALSDAGIQGSMAGTSLRRVLSSLANPTKDAARVIKDLQLNVDDLNPATNSIVEIVDRLAAAGIDAADALTIFGDRGGPAILALVENRQKLSDLTGELSNVGGEAKRMADTMRDQLGGDIKGLQSALEGLIIQLGESGLTAALSGLIKVMTSLARAVTGTIKSFSEMLASADRMLGVSQALGDAFSFLVGNIDVLVAAGTAAAIVFGGKFALALGVSAVNATIAAVTASIQLQMALGATSVSAALSSIAVKGLSLSVAGLRVAVSVLLGPVGIALALIVALTAAIVMNRRETQRLKDIQERYKNMLDASDTALKGATKRMEDYQTETQGAGEKAAVAETKVLNLAAAMRALKAASAGDVGAAIDDAVQAAQSLSISSIAKAVDDLNAKYGLQAVLLNQIKAEQSDSGLDGAVLFEAQANKATQLATAMMAAEKARAALTEAETRAAQLAQRAKDLAGTFPGMEAAKELEVQKQAVLDARVALGNYEQTLQTLKATNVDAFGGDLLDEQKTAAELATQKVQETIAGLQNQLTIDGQINDLQKEIASNILKAGLAIDDNSAGAKTIRDITTQLYNLDVARTAEADKLEKAKKAAETIGDLEREVGQLQRLNEALKFGEERYLAVAQAIAIEDFVRRNGLEGMDEEIKRISELIRLRGDLTAANDNTIAGFGNDGGMSETDRTRSRTRFEDLGGEMRGATGNAATRLQEEYDNNLKIIDDYQRAYTDKTAEAEQARTALLQQFHDAQTRLALSSAEQAFGAIADAMRDSLGEQSAAYKAMFALQQAFVIATASLNIAEAMSDALAEGTTIYEKIASMAIVATNAAKIMSAVNSVSLGFAQGGYTGSGAVNDVAGVVHKGEVVWSQRDVARYGGWQNVDAMRRGAMPAANDNAGAGTGGRIELDISISVDDEGAIQAMVTNAKNEAVNASVSISGQQTKAMLGAAAKDANRPVISARGAA